jgi:G:T-mismatch repair DNA endonuclease (very short patch repair protein)
VRFLLDQNVQDAVRSFLVDQGFEVFRVRDTAGAGAPDSLIAFVANSQGLVLITHDQHFRRFSRLLSREQRRQFEMGAGHIVLKVRENRSVERLQAEWRHILCHHADAEANGLRGQFVLTNTGFQVITNATMT